MPRRSQNYTKVTCAKGIDQQLSQTDPFLTCSDARNVWAPDGAIIKRPGYAGISFLGGSDGVGADILQGYAAKRVGTTYTVNAFSLSLAGLTVGDSWYLILTTLPAGWTPSQINGFTICVPTANTAAVQVEMSYWNGTSWAPIHFFYEGASLDPPGNYPDVPAATVHLGIADGGGGNDMQFMFPCPRDWALGTLPGGYSGYNLRFTIISGTISAGTNIEVFNGTTFGDTVRLGRQNTVNSGRLSGLYAGQFPSSKTYIAVQERIDGVSLQYAYIQMPNFKEIVSGDVVTAASLKALFLPVSAIIPQFNEFYLAHNYAVQVYTATGTSYAVAAVETDPLIIGTGAKYDPAYVSQLTSWPAAKYIEFYRGEMWSARLQDDPYGVRWSAPIPYYKVWPQLNYEPLMENDNSEISGIKGFQGHMTIFKGDSIWRMVDTGVSDFGLQTYSPERVVNGVGCVSHHSIQEVQNNLVFLAEDGIYLYNGTSEVRKISTRIQHVIDSISASKRETCTAVVWRSKSLYMLAVNNGQAQNNNLVLVWDYKNDAWWIWDDMTVVSWLRDENSADNETIYFGDDKGSIYQLGVGATSNGAAITSTLTTQRINGDQWSKALRQVEIIGTNDTRSLSVKLASNDAPLAQATAIALDFTDAAEKDWGSATWAVDSYVASRARQKKLGCRKDGEWFQLQLTHNTKYAPMEISEIHMGSQVLGRRK